ncbi:hypothetical protein M2459_002279 [Parabacteroides sp. PF5-5]|uniref:hypothetical protein n=1 Tax=unclassified Parabacteroides TaxID=2649774 RepID=UPI00247723BA|nr:MULTISPECIES: hypothetical protein [unclassified Parabacteroides]MDH6305182.1 hypothetical protein [Parabacteroides sp. PH5-39]MDH6316532.1 hypothetical protein [Parabacteroides sp. PF5-13]MDH6320042.1 hypothetical protein [Parabacteroides sp. PH5-13]MDH6323725.1 hypothetical protein [Parabacteroides sp. PH5-8]MDH6327719.1 hypothetical protein [Parabacteroides sp. PH5-41]
MMNEQPIQFNELEISSDISDRSSDVVNTPSSDIDLLNLDDQRKERYKQNTRHRGILSKWVMFVVSIWLLLVMCLLFLNKPLGLDLEGDVIKTLLTTTTINILGLPLIILRSLFKN